MNISKKTKMMIGLISLFIIGAFLFMFGGNIFNKNDNNSGNKPKIDIDYTVVPSATAVTEEITNGVKVEQSFVCPIDTISNVAVVFSKQYYVEDVKLLIELLDGTKVLASREYDVKDIPDQHRTFLDPASPISGMKNKELRLRISPVSKSDTGLAIMMNDTTGGVFMFDKRNVKGTLCFSVTE